MIYKNKKLCERLRGWEEQLFKTFANAIEASYEVGALEGDNCRALDLLRYCTTPDGNEEPIYDFQDKLANILISEKDYPETFKHIEDCAERAEKYKANALKGQTAIENPCRLMRAIRSLVVRNKGAALYLTQSANYEVLSLMEAMINRNKKINTKEDNNKEEDGCFRELFRMLVELIELTRLSPHQLDSDIVSLLRTNKTFLYTFLWYFLKFLCKFLLSYLCR